MKKQVYKLINLEMRSNEVIYKLVLLLQTSFENENESLTVYSLMVSSLSIIMIIIIIIIIKIMTIIINDDDR